MGTVQFIFIAIKPDTLPDLQAGIAATAAMDDRFNLTPVEYPIVLRESDDWAQYIDEYRVDPFLPPPGTVPDAPGIAIIDQTGKFYAIRHGSYDVHGGIDWVIRRLNELLGGRRPVDTVLVLDRSGTMGDLPPSGGTDLKIDILKDAVGVFLDVWEANAVPGDRVGVVDFSTSVNQYTQPGTGASLVPLVTDSVPVRSYVDSLSAGGWTSMGGGVARGLDILASSPRRHIILFSDGMQNYNPVLADVGWPIQILHVNPADVGSYDMVTEIYGDSGVPPKPGINLEDFDTHIHTIGVGLSGHPWTELMSGIAVQTDSLHFMTPAPEADLQNFYINDLLESFKGATPQLVQHTRSSFEPGEYAQDASWINSTARWLTVVLSWQGDAEHNQLLCSLEAPDGTLLEIDSRTKAGPRRRVISMPLPVYNYDRLVAHAGRWRLHITGTARTTVPYQVFWIVDDHRVHFDIKKPGAMFRVDEPFPLRAQLLLDGKPIPVESIQKARVKVSSPAVDFGKFFNSYQVDPARLRRVKKKMNELGIASETELKLYLLSKDKEAVAKCTKMHVSSVQMQAHNGELNSEFKFKIPGVHRLDLNVTATVERNQRIVRTRSLNILVKNC